MNKPRYRLATDAALHKGAQVVLREQPAHYLAQVLRLREGDAVALFNRADGEWRAVVRRIGKREVTLGIEECLRVAAPLPFHLTVCFAPIKGGRMETILEKATELGASVLQPVLTSRSIVDKVNLERADSIAREAAEQCERLDWPEIREPVKLLTLLGNWPADVPLIYGDESGESGGVKELFETPANNLSSDIPTSSGRYIAQRTSPPGGGSRRGAEVGHSGANNQPPPLPSPSGGGLLALTRSAPDTHCAWAILTGPEGGFTEEEFAALRHVKAARGVGLGPRILRADTAMITLATATLLAWGDWDARPRFIAD